jgi:F-type H+-transporting ATPase subunit alpha
MGATLFAVNKGYLDDLDVKKVLPFEHGLHQYLRDKHAALLQAIDKNGAKWDNKPAKDSDPEDKKAFKKMCIDAEAELAGAIDAFKKTFA